MQAMQYTAAPFTLSAKPRPVTLTYTQRAPVAASLAATVLLLRDGASGLEVLMTRRSHTASFAPGAYVFPGGKVDAQDAEAHHLATRRATQSDDQLTLAIAAIRECYEELGIALLHPASNEKTEKIAVDSARAAINSIANQGIEQLRRDAPFLPQVAALGLKLSANSVFTLARWVTDRDMPRRFDVPFLVARAPAGQEAVADETEQFEPVWVSPTDALARHAAGQFFMIFPTIRTLERLAAFADANAVLAACAQTEAPLWTSCPRAGVLDGQDHRAMEHDLAFGELSMVRPDGQAAGLTPWSKTVPEGGGAAHDLSWQSERPVQLLKHIARLTAPNPSAMTGPGTNTYIVGTAASGFVVIDPGPALAQHVERLLAACTVGGQPHIKAIACTHSHADHSPAAALLQAACVAAGGGKPAIHGMASAPTARSSAQFTPDVALTHGEALPVLTDTSGPAPLTIALRALHTPGHAANHLCFVLEEDGLLFSGDHILNGSTTVIDPPDGCMTAYLESLDLLAAACAQFELAHILPAHGWVMGSSEHPPAAIIAALKTHRFKREAKVQAALAACPQVRLPEAHTEGALKTLLPHAYADVSKQLWPIATRSLLAHVLRLQKLA